MQAQALSAFLMRYVLALIMALVLLRILHLALWQWIATRKSAGSVPPRIGVLRDSEGREYALDYDNILGRSRRCDIVLPDPSVTGVHAQIYRRRRVVYLQPFSRSGVYLNEEALKKRARIRNGDRIRLGEVALDVLLFPLHGAAGQQTDSSEDPSLL